MPFERLSDVKSSRFDALVARHTALDRKIRQEERNPYRNHFRIKDWKVAKLKIKEEIESFTKTA